jgi:hypothetical protein
MSQLTYEELKQQRDELIESIGVFRDTLENMLQSTQMPLPMHIHFEGLTGSISTMKDEMDAAIAKVSK